MLTAAFTVVAIGIIIFAGGFLVAAFSVVANFMSSSMDVSLKGFGIGFGICAVGAVVVLMGYLIGGAEVLRYLQGFTGGR